MDKISDQNDLIRRALNGEEPAFRELLDAYSGYAFSVAFRIVNDEEDARDIVQESFVSVWRQMGSYDTRKTFSNWLYRIVVNRCYDHLRKRNKVRWIRPDEGSWDMQDLISDDHPEKIMENGETGRIIGFLTQKLSPKQKLVFVLSELEERSHGEISEITGIPKDSVKSNLNHARRKIGELIKKYL